MRLAPGFYLPPAAIAQVKMTVKIVVDVIAEGVVLPLMVTRGCRSPRCRRSRRCCCSVDVAVLKQK